MTIVFSHVEVTGDLDKGRSALRVRMLEEMMEI